MKFLCAALAAALVATGAGCSAIHSRGCNNGPCHVANSRFAPGVMQQGRCAPNRGLFSGLSGLGNRSSCGDSCGDPCCGDGVCCESGGYGACGFGGQGCNACGNGCLQNGLHRVLDGACERDNNYNFNPGPPVGQVAYPYYTVRGPRDFLNGCPPSIGPR